MKETCSSILFDAAPLSSRELLYFTSGDNFGPWTKIDPRQIMDIKVKTVSDKADYLA